MLQDVDNRHTQDGLSKIMTGFIFPLCSTNILCAASSMFNFRISSAKFIITDPWKRMYKNIWIERIGGVIWLFVNTQLDWNITSHAMMHLRGCWEKNTISLNLKRFPHKISCERACDFANNNNNNRLIWLFLFSVRAISL